MEHEVLVLNSDYEPLNVCNLRRAILLVYLGKVDILHFNAKMVSTTRGKLDSPSVVRLKHHVRRPLPEISLSRRSLFARDNYTCQYCGHTARDLTLDHVIPKRLGGPTNWENLVCCCRKCNNKKGDKTLQQVGFTLNKLPRKPSFLPFVNITKFLSGVKNEVWRDYLPMFDKMFDRMMVEGEAVIEECS